VNVLYVEDDEYISALAKIFFVELNHVVILCDSVKSAKCILKKNRIDLILLDLTLLDESGITLLKYLDENKNKTPAIVISGHLNTYKDKLQQYIEKNIVLATYSKPTSFKGIVSDINTLLYAKR